VGKADLVAALHDQVLAELRRYKAVHSEGTHVQLRVAFHVGEVCQGSHGTVGDATSHASSRTPFPSWWTHCSRSLRSQGGKRLHVIALASVSAVHPGARRSAGRDHDPGALVPQVDALAAIIEEL
jgi:hypothetical protein